MRDDTVTVGWMGCCLLAILNSSFLLPSCLKKKCGIKERGMLDDALVSGQWLLSSPVCHLLACLLFSEFLFYSEIHAVVAVHGSAFSYLQSFRQRFRVLNVSYWLSTRVSSVLFSPSPLPDALGHFISKL
ncbi:hypothetical protein BKA80DRAFT_51119 [Phyllosticta citrichinensis]